MDLIKKKFSLDYLERLKSEIVKKKPYLSNIIDKNNSSTITVQPAKKQGYYFILENETFTSRIDPISEGERIFLNYKQKIEKSKIIFLLGLTNPYVFRLIFYQVQNQIFIVIEENENLIQFYWQYIEDFHKFLLTPNCHIFTKKNMDLLFHYLNSLNLENVRSYILIKSSSFLTKINSFYLEIEEKIYSLLKSNFSSLLTQFEFEKLWFTNIFCNLHFFRKDHPFLFLNFYKNSLKNLPFVIIGAGPSLRYSKKILFTLKNKAFLLATDTSLKPLLRMGIIPDGVHILDAQIFSYFHFRNINLKHILLFADVVVHPKLLLYLKPLGWIFSSTVKYKITHDGNIKEEKLFGMNLLENLFGSIAGLQSGGSVSTSAFEIARFLGAKTIFLIGMDLAWTKRQMHCVHTHHYEKWYAQIHRILSLEMINEMLLQKRIISKIKGIRNTYTYGDAVLNLYRDWFEQSALELKDQIQIYNLTYDGAYIQNIGSISNVDFLPDINKKEILNLFSQYFQDYTLNLNQFTITRSLLKKIINLIDTFDMKNDFSSKEDFFYKFLELQEEFRDLEVFSHKILTYIKRNSEKITKEKSIEIFYKNVIKDLRKFIKSYITFNTSFTHSDRELG